MSLKSPGARVVLLVLIGTGVVLRVVGLDWGIPRPLSPEATTYRSSFHFDEDNYLWGLTRMQPDSWNFDVHDFHWGTLQFYLIAAALEAAQRFGYLTRPWKDSFLHWDPANFPRVYLTGRMVSALAGMLSLPIIFLVGKRLRDIETGLASAAFLAVAPIHVVNSHFLTSDVTMVLLLLTAFYFFLNSLESSNAGPHLAGGFFLGLAVAAKYNAACLVPLWIGKDVFLRNTPWKRKIWAYAGMVAGFAAGEPYAFRHPFDLLGTIYRAHFAKIEAVDQFLLTWPQLLWEQGRALLNYGILWPVAIPALFGTIFCIASPSKKKLSLAAAIFLMTLSLVGARWPMIRYTLPVAAFLILASAFALASIPVRGSWRPWIYGLIGLALLLASWSQVRILVDEHTANRAALWVDAQVPEGSRIGQIWPELPLLDSRRYNLHMLHGILPHDTEDARDLDREYLILDNLPLGSFTESFSKRLAEEYVLVTEFRSDPKIGFWVIDEENAPHDWKYTHPVMRLYRRK